MVLEHRLSPRERGRRRPGWVAEYVADDTDSANESIFVFSAGGTKDEMWFSGGRSTYPSLACPVLIRKTAADGYRRVVDGVVDYGAATPCLPRTGLVFGGDGWMTDIQAAGGGRVVGLRKAETITRLVPTDGSYAVDFSTLAVTVPNQSAPDGFSSLWIQDGKAWLSGWGFVLRGEDVPNAGDAGDAGGFQLSTISLSGAPLNALMFQVRGTSNTNLWAIGARYALHKTTP